MAELDIYLLLVVARAKSIEKFVISHRSFVMRVVVLRALTSDRTGFPPHSPDKKGKLPLKRERERDREKEKKSKESKMGRVTYKKRDSARQWYW